jgi:hypothetical protein
MKRAYLVVAAVLLAHLCSTKGVGGDWPSKACNLELADRLTDPCTNCAVAGGGHQFKMPGKVHDIWHLQRGIGKVLGLDSSQGCMPADGCHHRTTAAKAQGNNFSHTPPCFCACRCDCPKHMDGPDCSTPASRRTLRIRCDRQLYPDVNACLRPSDGSGGPDAGPTCLNDCNKRGACISGWCHCKPGTCTL